MRCPWCGSPVMVRGSSWECGWCGDSGRLKRTPVQQPAQITLTLSFVYHVDLPETWNDLKKALGQIAPKGASLSQLLGKVLLHNISVGIQHAGALPDEKKAEELRTFLTTTTDLNLGESAEEIMRDAKRGALFCEEATLSEADCGTFWAELLATRPVEDYYNRVDPDGLFELFSELSSAYAYFGGKKDEEMGEAQDYQSALEEAYNTHWQDKVLLHPDIERAKRLLAQGKFPDYEDICREILLVEYPEEVPHDNAEDFDELSWNYILDDVFTSNTAKGIQMWRRLLDIAEPSLKTDPKTSEKLLPDWDWLESPTDDQALPLLVALDDERFVSQVFESAYIGRLQLDVLNACRSYGQEELGQHCLELALKNSCLEENWKKRLSRVFTTTSPSRTAKPRSYTGKPIADTKPDDGTVYHYCSVQVQGTHRPYAYLTGGLPLKVGDWVELPFGKDDVLRCGQVKAVMDCTRMVAPWPPEQTKTVIRTIDAPVAVTPTIEVAAPKKQKAPPVPSVQEEIAVVSMPRKAEEPPAVQSVPEESASFEVKPILEEPTVTLPPLPEREEPKKPKRRIPWGWLAAAALAAFVIFAVPPLERIAETNRQQIAAQQAAEQAKREREERRAEQARQEEEAAAQRRREEREAAIQAQMDAGLPYIGMSEGSIDSTRTLGTHGTAKKEQHYEHDWRGNVKTVVSVTYTWYTENRKAIFTATCEDEKVVETLALGGSSCWNGNKLLVAVVKPESLPLQTFNSSSSSSGKDSSFSSGSTGLRDEYDNPEDLYEDNPDWFEDEDEAWDAWEND